VRFPSGNACHAKHVTEETTSRIKIGRIGSFWPAFGIFYRAKVKIKILMEKNVGIKVMNENEYRRLRLRERLAVDIILDSDP
jgi:hypothetical protein